MVERIKREIRAGLKKRPKRVIDLLKKISKYGKISYKKNYYHIRLRKPIRKKEIAKKHLPQPIFKYLDIGRPKGHKLLRMKIYDKHKKYKWVTQKVIVEKKKLDKETLEIVKRAKKYQQ